MSKLASIDVACRVLCRGKDEAEALIAAVNRSYPVTTVVTSERQMTEDHTQRIQCEFFLPLGSTAAYYSFMAFCNGAIAMYHEINK